MTTPDRSEEVLLASRADVVTAAESKLSRPLSPEERAGIERIDSLMRLESIYRGFASSVYSVADVEFELRYLASEPPA